MTNREWMEHLTDEQLAKFLTLGLRCNNAQGDEWDFEACASIQSVALQFNQSVYGLQEWFSKSQQYKERE